MKKFLLIAGSGYYPQSGTDDWVGCFSSWDEARAQVKVEEIHEYFSKGPRKGQIKQTREQLFVNGNEEDWYDIVDLEEWMNS
jgi:hypothetical protein